MSSHIGARLGPLIKGEGWQSATTYMLQILTDCPDDRPHTGAPVAAIVFLAIFSLLILGDAVATAFALSNAVKNLRSVNYSSDSRDAQERGAFLPRA